MTTFMQRFNGTIIDIEDLLIWAFRDQEVEAAVNPHPDATTVYWAVTALPAAHARIVSRFARRGMGPDWHAGAGTVVSIADVRKGRMVHAEWVRAMVVLQSSLEGNLTHYRVTGPRLDEAPWRVKRA